MKIKWELNGDCDESLWITLSVISLIDEGFRLGRIPLSGPIGLCHIRLVTFIIRKKEVIRTIAKQIGPGYHNAHAHTPII